jgi:hypothetical protein
MKLFGCFAATKMRVALSIPTVSSVGECRISSAFRSSRHRSHQVVLGDIVEKFPLDMEWAAGERDLDRTLRADVRDAIGEQMRDMSRIGGRSDGHDRSRFGDLPRGCENGRAAEAVADQNCRRLAGLT